MSVEEANKIFKIIDTNNNGYGFVNEVVSSSIKTFEKLCLYVTFFFLFYRGIDVIEWKSFLTPQLQLSKIFRAKPSTEVNCK